jgi:hypothetical protein
LKAAATSNSYVHVLEDDAILSEFLAPVASFGLRLNLFSVFDIVFLDLAIVPGQLENLRAFKLASAKAFRKPKSEISPNDFAFLDIATLDFRGMSSLVVSPHALPKLLELYEAEWQIGPTLALDIFLMRAIHNRRVRAGCILPFLTSMQLDDALDTQSDRQDLEGDVVATNMIRRSFFIGRNMTELKEEVRKFSLKTSAVREQDEHYDLLHQLLSYFLIDRQDLKQLKDEAAIKEFERRRRLAEAQGRA